MRDICLSCLALQQPADWSLPMAFNRQFFSAESHPGDGGRPRRFEFKLLLDGIHKDPRGLTSEKFQCNLFES